MVATQEIVRYVRLRATVRNLLGAEVRRAYFFKGDRYLAGRFDPGRTFSLSLSLSY